jgi:hypothetical protein
MRSYANSGDDPKTRRDGVIFESSVTYCSYMCLEKGQPAMIPTRVEQEHGPCFILQGKARAVSTCELEQHYYRARKYGRAYL